MLAEQREFSQQPNYLGFFFNAACDKADAAVVLAGLEVVGLLSCLEATFATRLLVSLGFMGISISFFGMFPIKKFDQHQSFVATSWLLRPSCQKLPCRTDWGKRAVLEHGFFIGCLETM